jgi:multiple sugar transport system ATP-binding protein
MAYLELEGITKRFPETLAVDNLDLEVEEGEFLVLLGPSGCGKTTTLRIVAGLEVQTEGKVILEGVDVSDVSPERRDMAMVFQNLALYPHMTVFDNIAFYLKNIRTPKDEIDKRVIHSAKRVQIEELLERYPEQLSGGQRQRVALARALVRSPKVFLLDEPLAALDAKLRASMRSEFKLLHKSLAEEADGVSGTFIYVTHDQVEALTLGTRIAVINEGQLVQLSSPMELYNNPNHIFTAAFVGSPEMNLVDGILQRTGDETIFTSEIIELKTGETGLTVLNEVSEETFPVTLGFRPESALIVSPDMPDALLAQVLSVELLGQSTLVLLDIHGKMFSCLASSDTPVKEEEKVGISIPPEKMYFFDAHTGNNLLVRKL